MVAIFVALMFVGLVLTDLCLEKWPAWRAKHIARRALETHPARNGVGFGLDARWQVPEGIHLSDQHTWCKADPRGGIEVGADSLIAHVVGAVRGIILPEVGNQVNPGQPLCRLELKGRTLVVPSALAGRVVAVNSRLHDRPELLSSDPYGSGWICYLTPTQAEEPAPHMRFGENAMRWMEEEFVRLREFLSAQIPPDLALNATSHDGGLPAVGCLGELDSKAWTAFEEEFLKRK